MWGIKGTTMIVRVPRTVLDNSEPPKPSKNVKKLKNRTKKIAKNRQKIPLSISLLGRLYWLHLARILFCKLLFQCWVAISRLLPSGWQNRPGRLWGWSARVSPHKVSFWVPSAPRSKHFGNKDFEEKRSAAKFCVGTQAKGCSGSSQMFNYVDKTPDQAHGAFISQVTISGRPLCTF